MKIEELKKAIRHLVRQEVKKIVAEEVSKAMGKVLVEMVKEIKSNNSSPIVEEVEEAPSRAAILQTKNPKLNAVRSESVRHPIYPSPYRPGYKYRMGFSGYTVHRHF